jgi:hypothetical protein
MRLTQVCRSSRGDWVPGIPAAFDYGAEFAADVGGVEFTAVYGGEHRPGRALDDGDGVPPPRWAPG